jgi:hypothetical protein
MIELTTIKGEKILVRLKDIRAIESAGYRTIIFFKNNYFSDEMVEERYDYIKDVFEKWLKRK